MTENVPTPASNTTVLQKDKPSTDNVEDFVLSILLILVLPLVPAAIGLWQGKGQLQNAELMLTASMYALGTGISSSKRWLFVLTLIMGLLFGMAYGIEKGQNAPLSGSNFIGYISIVIVFFLYVIERWRVHVVQHKKWEFLDR